MDMVLEVLLSGTQFRKLLEQRYAFLEREHGLRRIDVQILCRLYAARERNTAKDIAGLGLFAKGHVSQSLHRLQQLGYITAATDDADHRCAHLRLTPAALALAERASAE